jgi:hypothetical protein
MMMVAEERKLLFVQGGRRSAIECLASRPEVLKRWVLALAIHRLGVLQISHPFSASTLLADEPFWPTY